MEQVLSFLTEIDETDYQIEFVVYFDHAHITGIKIDSVFKVDRGPSDSTLWTKLSIESLGEPIKSHILKQAQLMSEGVCLQVPDREYFTEQDAEHY